MSRNTLTPKYATQQSVHTDKESLIFLSLCLITIAGVFHSTAITTAGEIGLLLFGLRYITLSKLRNFWSDRTMMPFLLVFVGVFLSGFNTEHTELWHTALRVKLPFLLLPVAFYMMPKMQKGTIERIHLGLIIILMLTALPVSYKALSNMDQMIDLLAKGQPIPTPIEHVKYSMFNSYGVIAALILLFHQWKTSSLWYNLLLGLSAVFLFAFMHLLAVRTGLAIVYVSLALLGVYVIVRTGQKWMYGVLLAGLILVPLLIYSTMPSVRQKVGYMLYDWQQHQKGEGANYSDSERILSYQAAADLWSKAPILGIGYGDVLMVSHEYYDRVHQRPDLFKLPHSQFLLVLSGSGILGLIIFLAGFYTPLIRADLILPHRILILFLFMNYTLSFLVENSLERSMSVAFFLILALSAIRMGQRESKFFSEPGYRNV